MSSLANRVLLRTSNRRNGFGGSRGSSYLALALLPLLVHLPSLLTVSSFAFEAIGTTRTIIRTRTRATNHRHYSSLSSLSSSSSSSSSETEAPMTEQQQQQQQQQEHEPHKRPQRLVLVGGGHSHLQVIKGLNSASRPENLEVVLIDATDRPCYSGMVPGAVAGIYKPTDTLIGLQPLADWAGIRFVGGDRVVDIDLDHKAVLTEGNRRIEFDAISIDIGSTSRGLSEIPGARDYTIPTRPITELVRRIDEATKELELETETETNRPTARVVVVGAGAAGMELSMALASRWKPILGDNNSNNSNNNNSSSGSSSSSSNNLSVTVLNAMDQLVPDETPANRAALDERLRERGIDVLHNAVVEKVDRDSLKLASSSGETIPFTHCIWATGAECHSSITGALRKRGLAISNRGWIEVNEHFQSPSHPFVFAAGDCCTMLRPGGLPPPPKAGVYAVRAGPVLIENLTRFLGNMDTESVDGNGNGNGNANDDTEDNNNNNNNNDAPPQLHAYEPQEDFLKLLACGDGKALGFRFGIPFYGKWVFDLKDAIDRSFVGLFDVRNLPVLEHEHEQRSDNNNYDTAQYDAVPASDRRPPFRAIDAAALLLRTDDGVDYEEARDVLRDMADDVAYRDEVVKHVEQQIQIRLEAATATVTATAASIATAIATADAVR